MARKDGVIPTHIGKYRAYVAEVNDPLNMGRIRVLCPNVLGDSLSAWCLPCVPTAYDGGGDFHYPKKGEMVWIEFEDDDLRKPIYTGTIFSQNGCPSPKVDEDFRIISWGSNKILMEKDRLTITNGKSKVLLEGNQVTILGNSDVTLGGSNSLTLQGKTVSILSDNANMVYEDGEAGMDSSYGTIHISENSIDIEHNKGSKVLLKEGCIDIIVEDPSTKDRETLSLTPNFIKHLKSL